MTRVVLAEDAALLREGLVGLLTRLGFEVVAAVGDADALLGARRASTDPDLVVTDIRMPPGPRDEGLRAAVALRAERPGLAGRGAQPVRRRRATRAELLDSGGGRAGRLPAQGPGRRRPRVRRRAATGSPAASTVVDPEVVRQLLHGAARPAATASPTASARCWR